MCRDFNAWFGTLRTTITQYEDITDLDKVVNKVQACEDKVMALKSCTDDVDYEAILSKLTCLAQNSPEVFECIPYLLAVTDSKVTVYDARISGEREYNFSKIAIRLNPTKAAADALDFMCETNLIGVLRQISNVHDFILGLEIGLDSNARKNRGGKLMESLVEDYLKEIPHLTQAKYDDIMAQFNIDLTALSHGSNTVKCFDFVFAGERTLYVVETNFYNSPGSKLNECARSYIELQECCQNIQNLEFVWITDGLRGWIRSKNNLQEAFGIIPHLYNINDLECGILNELCKR